MTPGGPSLPLGERWQMPGKHCSPRGPPLATQRGAGQARLRAAGTQDVIGVSSSCRLRCRHRGPRGLEEAGLRLGPLCACI